MLSGRSPMAMCRPAGAIFHPFGSNRHAAPPRLPGNSGAGGVLCATVTDVTVATINAPGRPCKSKIHGETLAQGRNRDAKCVSAYGTITALGGHLVRLKRREGYTMRVVWVVLIAIILISGVPTHAAVWDEPCTATWSSAPTAGSL